MKNRLKILATLITVAIGATFVSGCGNTGKSSGSSKADSKEIVIGAVAPLTGDIATFGKSSEEALKLLEEQVNKEGILGGKKIKFSIQDDENDPTKSANAVQKLIDDDVVAIIGPVSSKCAMSAGPVATKEKTLMMTSTATNPKVTTEGGEYVYRACFIDPFQGTILAKFASGDLKAKTAAIVYDKGNDYTVGLAEYFEKGFKAAGGTIVDSELYTGGDTDFKTQLTKIKDKNPDVILLPDYYSSVGLIAKQARELGITAAFLGADGWDSPELYKIAGDSINGGYFTNHYSPDDKSPKVVDFVSAYKSKYNGKTPDALACLAYDGGALVIEAIKKAGSADKEAIKEAMKTLETEVVSGKVKFDKDRNPIKSIVVLKVNKDKQEYVKTVAPD
jgi:branched-chain amino acid transport system substrate-binding protein